MQKRIVVLGGVGFIGSHLCRRLIEAGHEVFCIDQRDVANAPLLRSLQHEGSFHYIHHNIIHPFGIRCDELYNLAAPSMVHYAKALAVESLKLHMAGTIHTLDTARNQHARVVYASSGALEARSAVCSTTDEITTDELLCEGKRAAEALHRAYHSEFGVDTRIARLYNTYGEGAELMDQRIVMKMVVAALQNRNITIEGRGSQVRTFCYVEDVVEGLIRLMALPRSRQTRLVELGSDYEITIRQLAERIIALTGSRSEIVHTEGSSHEPKRSIPNLEQAHNVLDWHPTTSLDEGLKRTIRYAENALGQHASSYITWIEINN